VEVLRLGLALLFLGLCAFLEQVADEHFCRGQDGILVQPLALDQRADDAAVKRLARPDGHVHAHIGQRPFIVGGAPVAFQALRGYAGAHGAAELDALGIARIVAVQQDGGIAGQGVDLQKAGGGGHQEVSPDYSAWRAV